VKPAGLRHHVLPGTLVQVVGVAEQDLRAERAQLVGRQAAHRTEGRHGLKRGRLDHTMRRRERAAAGVAVPGRDAEREARAHQRISIASPYE
jgi:hypothetical protein